MSCITLPDGAQKKYEKTLTALDVARDIGTGLARVAIAAKVNGQLVDLSYCLPEGSEVDLAIVTGKDPEGLEVIRHSTAHLLAHAVKSLFPTVKIAIGPVIEDGFYYDFNLEHTLTPEDLPKIEKKMQELIKANYPIARRVLSRAEAIALFEQLNEDYKVKIIEKLPEDSEITVYEQGDFIDLCRGPHVPSTGLLKAFKLTKLAGAYWLGDSDNEMLQRVYGTAWPDKQSLKDYLHRMEEAERRDHRLIAKKMDLFHLQPNAPGMVFWHANGWTVIRLLREYIREVQQRAGYQEINTPQLVDAELWEQSGHLAKFGDDMFTIPTDRSPVVIKPMSCPCHVQVFKQGITSYRDLPLRLAEFGHCHRNEPSGTLHGLMRVRGFVQDDGHVFCEEQQIQPEVLAFIDQLREVYSVFGFDDIIYKLSTRPDQRIGSEEQWDRAEQALGQALDATGVEWGTLPGEGAFYGPKIEFSLKDCIGRVWQCGTIQVDFSMPGRLGAHYIDEQGDKKTPVMLHRAILGSCERFLAILIEHYEGRLPLWLAPIQLVAMGITDETHPYITKVVENLKNRGFRVISDLRNEKIGYKIREHTIARIPYQLVVGMREVEKGQVTIRADGDDLDGQSMPVEALIAILLEKIENKGK